MKIIIFIDGVELCIVLSRAVGFYTVLSGNLELRLTSEKMRWEKSKTKKTWVQVKRKCNKTL